MSTTSVSDHSSPAPKKVHPPRDIHKPTAFARLDDDDRITTTAERPIQCGRRTEYPLSSLPPMRFQKPNPLDHTFHYAGLVLENYNAQSFARSADPLLIEALNVAPTMFYADESTSAVHCLVRHETFIKVQLKLSADLYYGLGWNNPTVMVKDDTRWIPLHAFLETLGPPELSDVGRSGYKLQWLWWRTMNKPFRFLELPEEIKRTIVLHGLGERVAPRQAMDDETYDGVPQYHTLVTKGASNHYLGNGDYQDPTEPRPVSKTNVAWLFLNKATRKMALDVLNKDTVKVYPTISSLLVHTPPFLTFLRRLELCFGNLDYIKFFHAEIKPFNIWEETGEQAPAAVLKTLPNLMRIELYFRAPTTVLASPWRYSRLSHSTYEHRATGIDLRRSPCQSVLVDWILCFAAEHLRGIQTVKLTGYLKTVTRQKWEGILNDKSAFDHTPIIEAQQQEIRKTRNVDLPPPCFCPTPCEYFLTKRLRRREHGPCYCQGHCYCNEDYAKAYEWKDAFKQYRFDFDDTGLPGVTVSSASGYTKTPLGVLMEKDEYDDKLLYDTLVAGKNFRDQVLSWEVN